MKILASRPVTSPVAATLLILLGLAFGLSPGAFSASAADSGGGALERHFSIAGKDLILTNLIGEVRVESSPSSSYEIDVAIRGKDATAERIRFDEASGDDAHLYVKFPTGESRKFVYPSLGRSEVSITERRVEGKGDSGHLLDLFVPGHRKSLRVSGTGSGLEIWADIVVRVPEGVGIHVRHGVGPITASEVAGMCDLDTQAGSVEAGRISGRVRIDTGSGGVNASQIDGDLSIDTGSGAVEAVRCNGSSVRIDTGSGDVRVAEIECLDLSIDTGSGGVRGEKVGADAAKVDTGSGSVSMSFVRMGAGPFLVDTGSGSVAVRLPADASAEILAETGSGGIRAEVPDATVTHKSDGKLALVIGSGASKLRIDTGSGAVRIDQ